MSRNLCLLCKGSKGLCGKNPCPLLASHHMKMKLKHNVSKDFFGPSTSVFVGSYNYPNVFVGPMASMQTELTKIADNPGSWFGQDYSRLIEMRSAMLRSKFSQDVKSIGRYAQENQLLAMAKKPTDVELNFNKKPVFDLRFSSMIQPMGPSAALQKMMVTENIKIDKWVDYIVSDDLKAAEAAGRLYENKQDVYKITNILSSGALGKKKKIVPTRWSITATDDIIFKEVVGKVKDHRTVNQYIVYSSNYLDNHFEILLMPGSWEFENFEAWSPDTPWSQGAKETQILEEYESFKGRKKYAKEQAGGYYAARLGIIEGLNDIKRQARVISFREISPGYNIPMGVWVVRETVRNAFKNSPIKFDTLKEALNHIDSKLKIPVSEYRKKSRMLQQRTIFDF